MPDGSDTILEFSSAVERNGRIYLLARPYAFHAFAGINEYFDRLGRRLQTGYDRDGNSHVGLLPFVLLMQRQALNAFEMLATFRSYEAWVLLRPCLESALIIGKWVDDPGNAVLWDDKRNRFEEFKKAYQGKGLQSRSLPQSAKIQAVLSRVNDEFMHPNPSYYRRHTRFEGMGEQDLFLKVEFFDDNDDSEAHSLAFLHVLVVIVDAVDELFAKLFVGQAGPAPQVTTVERELRSRADSIAAKHELYRRVLTELGLWDALPAA